jgi:hypothetical protein
LNRRRYRNRLGGIRFETALLVFGAACFTSSGQTAPGNPEDAVRAWYQIVDDASDQAHLKEFGTVGEGLGPLEDAYRNLAPTLRSQMTGEEFLAGYRGLAHLSLLQSHIMPGAPLDSAQVFVEEERTMAMEGVPVMAWFVGPVTVTKTGDGWKISDLKGVKPEDIISTVISGHLEAPEVAMASLHCNATTACTVKSRMLPQNTATRLGRVAVQILDGLYTVSLAKLHDGAWVVIETKQETSSPGK